MDSTLLKGLDIFERAVNAERPVTVSELARAMGLPKSNIHRTLTTLTAAGYLQHDPVERHYTPSLKPVILGQQVAARYPFRASLMPHLEALAAETGETAAFALPMAAGMVFLAHALPGRSLAAVLPENARYDPGDTAFGQALEPGAGHALRPDHPERHTFELAIPLAEGGLPALGAIGLVGPASRYDADKVPAQLSALIAARARAMAQAEPVAS
ncbi:IclR family transcriptional regulator [Pararhodobacter zhoushanensis]|uniref:IclR family transcriptional regulator n=1 Tax=Pararhodobacter zhoushanensis TaxID=2479545 RepID=UPI0013DFD5A3|nr:helix-turn-helix domain-containing protein [Pararhodobacter zhoushanensis]